MNSVSRASWRAPALACLAVLTLAGCGASGDPTAGATTSAPTVAVPSPTVTFTDDPTDDATDDPSEDPTASADVQVVKIRKFGVSFELPKGWITLDAKKVLNGGVKNAFLAEMAERLGVTQQQLLQSFSTLVQTFSVSDAGAVHGFLSNVNTVGQEGDVNDDQLKLQLATIGAKPGELGHATTDAGEVTRIPYVLTSKAGVTIRGVALAVHTSSATVLITVSSSSASESGRLADQVQSSLKTLPGTAPGA
ncbi:hypothetical protein ACVW00_002767 [Marmoricola sp. URHA0025 HA25]